LAFDIVKYIIETKKDEAEQEKKKKLAKEKKQKILSLIEEKEDEKLKDMDVADLKRMVQEL